MTTPIFRLASIKPSRAVGKAGREVASSSELFELRRLECFKERDCDVDSSLMFNSEGLISILKQEEEDRPTNLVYT